MTNFQNKIMGIGQSNSTVQKVMTLTMKSLTIFTIIFGVTANAWAQSSVVVTPPEAPVNPTTRVTFSKLVTTSDWKKPYTQGGKVYTLYPAPEYLFNEQHERVFRLTYDFSRKTLIDHINYIYKNAPEWVLKHIPDFDPTQITVEDIDQVFSTGNPLIPSLEEIHDEARTTEEVLAMYKVLGGRDDVVNAVLAEFEKAKDTMHENIFGPDYGQEVLSQLRRAPSGILVAFNLRSPLQLLEGKTTRMAKALSRFLTMVNAGSLIVAARPWQAKILDLSTAEESEFMFLEAKTQIWLYKNLANDALDTWTNLFRFGIGVVFGEFERFSQPAFVSGLSVKPKMRGLRMANLRVGSLVSSFRLDDNLYYALLAKQSNFEVQPNHKRVTFYVGGSMGLTELANRAGTIGEVAGSITKEAIIEIIDSKISPAANTGVVQPGTQQPPASGGQQPPASGGQQQPTTGGQPPTGNGQQPPANGGQQPPANGNQPPTQVGQPKPPVVGGGQ